MAQQYPQQFTSPCFSCSQTNFSHHYQYRPEFPTPPLAQPSPNSQHDAAGQTHYPHAGHPLPQPHSGARMLAQELAAAQSRIIQYTNLISNLYAELETIHSIVCHDCKERISPDNLTQRASHVPDSMAWGLHNLGYHLRPAPDDSQPMAAGALAAVPFSSSEAYNAPFSQVDPQNTQLASSSPASPIPTTRSHSLVVPTTPSTPPPSEPAQVSTPPETPPTESMRDVAVIANPIAGLSQNRKRTVTHNSEIEKELDISFIHAFEHASSVNAVRFSRDGRLLAAGLTYGLGSRTLIYNLETKSMMCILAEYSNKHDKKPRHVWCVCFSSDGKHVVAGASDGVVCMWGVDSRRVRATFKGHNKDVRSLDISPNNLFIIAGSHRSVRIWKIRDGSSKILSTEGRLFTSVRFSPNGQYAAASNTDQFLRIWDVRSGQLVGRWNGHGESLRSIAFSPDGRKLVSGSIVGGMKSWDIRSAKVPTRSDRSVEKPQGVLVQTNEKLKFDGHSGEVRSAAISSDGKWVITGSSDRRVRIWNLHTAVRHCTLDGHVDELWAVDSSPVGNYIATGSRDGVVTLWRYKRCAN